MDLDSIFCTCVCSVHHVSRPVSVVIACWFWLVEGRTTQLLVIPSFCKSHVVQRVTGKVKGCGTPVWLRGRIPLGFHASSLCCFVRRRLRRISSDFVVPRRSSYALWHTKPGHPTPARRHVIPSLSLWQAGRHLRLTSTSTQKELYLHFPPRV